MKQYIYDGTSYVLHEDVVGLSELPTPSAKYLDKAFLLTADQTGFTKGVIYECHEVTPATDPKTYEWVAVTTEANGMYKVYSGTYDSVEGEFYDADGNALPKVNMQQYYDIATRTTWIYITTSDTFFRIFSDVVNMGAAEMISPLIKPSYPEMKAAELRCMNVYGNDGGLIEGFIYKLNRVSVTPEAGDSPVDEGWWEVDSTTGKMIQTTDTEVVSGKLYFDYVWTQVKTQQSVFPGTLDEWNALTEEEQAKYDFIASPEEASDVEPWEDLSSLVTTSIAGVTLNDVKCYKKGNLVSLSFDIIIADTVTLGAATRIFENIPKPVIPSIHAVSNVSDGTIVWAYISPQQNGFLCPGYNTPAITVGRTTGLIEYYSVD